MSGGIKKGSAAGYGKIEGVIFDVDGTLVDSMPIWDDLGARYIRQKELIPETNLGEILFSMTMAEGAGYLKENYLPDLTTSEIIDGLNELLRQFYESEVPLKDGMVTLLHAIRSKNIPMSIVSLSDTGLIKSAFSRLQILDYFQNIITAGETGTGKNSPLMYEDAASHMNSRKEHTLVFEDSLDALRTVKKSGFIAIGVYDLTSEAYRSEIEDLCNYYISCADDCRSLAEQF